MLPALLLLLLFLLPAPITPDCVMDEQATWCGCGYMQQALGPCVGGECPDGYMCICDYCCEGCMDDCYDCALYAQFCNNTNYCDLRQKCKRTCGICMDAATT
ncbi:hypothetical protein PRIPAC_84974 [Pristionchus pacificus]|uniref:ShKT domain-containing protein n=1 Tax=Pristionchus pacificus TaxID=54126 RepID=A0A2A6CC14_PRIPA|nr:hypothetical protein PRIPAC_84974 [Pristionchus pacificus]|eukprot:PDM75765.1 hypothetical protein PRIPAC_40144 [Pristionchus pacificus]